MADSDSSSNISEQGHLHQALHYAVGTICRSIEENEAHDNNNSPNDKCDRPHMCKNAIEALTQLTYHYATRCLRTDLIAFSTHANRKTITHDDVKLVARKNPELLESLEIICDGEDRGSLLDRFGDETKKKVAWGQTNKRQKNDFDTMGLTQKRDYLIKQAESSSDESTTAPNKSNEENNENPSFKIQVESSSSSDDNSCNGRSALFRWKSGDTQVRKRVKRNSESDKNDEMGLKKTKNRSKRSNVFDDTTSDSDDRDSEREKQVIENLKRNHKSSDHNHKFGPKNAENGILKKDSKEVHRIVASQKANGLEDTSRSLETESRKL